MEEKKEKTIINMNKKKVSHPIYYMKLFHIDLVTFRSNFILFIFPNISANKTYFN